MAALLLASQTVGRKYQAHAQPTFLFSTLYTNHSWFPKTSCIYNEAPKKLLNKKQTAVKENTIIYLPLVLQMTTSLRCGCVPVYLQLPVPCTPQCHRRSRPSSHGQWLLYTDQNLKRKTQSVQQYCSIPGFFVF